MLLALRMAKNSQNLYAVRDRETLVRLDSGVEIIRAMKHEPVSFQGKSDAQIVRLTNKINGSKFAHDWTLEQYVQWLSAVSQQQGWQFPPSLHHRIQLPLTAAVGVADGKPSHTIEVVAQGRYVHAYPVPD